MIEIRRAHMLSKKEGTHTPCERDHEIVLETKVVQNSVMVRSDKYNALFRNPATSAGCTTGSHGHRYSRLVGERGEWHLLSLVVESVRCGEERAGCFPVELCMLGHSDHEA